MDDGGAVGAIQNWTGPLIISVFSPEVSHQCLSKKKQTKIITWISVLFSFKRLLYMIIKDHPIINVLQMIQYSF